MSNPAWLTDKLISELYAAEAEWRTHSVRAPDEIAFHPDDIGEATHLIGYRVVTDGGVVRGTFEFRRIHRTVRHVETRTFSSEAAA